MLRGLSFFASLETFHVIWILNIQQSFENRMQPLNRMRYLRPTVIALVTVSLLLLGGLITPVFSTIGQSQLDTFEQVWQTVNDNFFDSELNGVDWQHLYEQYKPQAQQAQTRAELAKVVNQMLDELQTSHTRFYTPDEPAYYQLLGIFQPEVSDLPPAAQAIFPNGQYEYTGIGIFTQTRQNKIFISGILEGSPADQAGLQVGDELLSVEGQPYQPIASFADKAGQSVTLLIQRSPDPQSRQEINVTPQVLNTTTLFKEAQQASTQIVEQQNHRLGYLHIWSNAADFHQQQMIEDLMFGKLAEAEGLVLDLRDGWGGGSVEYLNFFTGESPSITTITRDGTVSTPNYRWNKPTVLLINEGSRSSKEIVAFGFQQAQIGPLVGTKTAGAVVAGRAFVMQDGSLLYVAVADVLVNGNQRLEGKGVMPEIKVTLPLEYAAGNDPQKQQAIDTLIHLIEKQP
jgi:carboxyl-terminal processing protease